MNRRRFTFGAFFASIGTTIGKALGYDGQPQKPLSTIMPEGIGKFIDTTTGTDGQYSIKVGRKIMVLPRGAMGSGGWDVYADTAPPSGLKSWSEAPHAIKPHIDGPTYASVDDLRGLREEIGLVMHLPRTDVRVALAAVWRKLDDGIRRRENFCSGHNGPALGLTAHNPMTDMGDGRRLCPYCYNKEIADGRGADDPKLTS